MASAQFPDADWLTLDCVQTGHTDFPHSVPNWFSTSCYLPVRTMYKNAEKVKGGKLRPVIDLEPHYESTHHSFDVSPTRATFRLMDTVSDIVLSQSQQPTRPVWGAADIRNGGYQAVSSGLHGRPIMKLAHRISLADLQRNVRLHLWMQLNLAYVGPKVPHSQPASRRGQPRRLCTIGLVLGALIVSAFVSAAPNGSVAPRT